MTDKDADFHFTRTIPIGLIITILIQLAAVIWFTAKTDSRILALEEWKMETSQNRFTSKDGQLLTFQVEANSVHITRIYQKLDRIADDVTDIKIALGVHSPEFGG